MQLERRVSVLMSICGLTEEIRDYRRVRFHPCREEAGDCSEKFARVCCDDFRCRCRG